MTKYLCIALLAAVACGGVDAPHELTKTEKSVEALDSVTDAAILGTWCSGSGASLKKMTIDTNGVATINTWPDCTRQGTTYSNGIVRCDPNAPIGNNPCSNQASPIFHTWAGYRISPKSVIPGTSPAQCTGGGTSSVYGTGFNIGTGGLNTTDDFAFPSKCAP